IVAMSIRVSRLNIIRAIRDIAEPPPRRRKRWLYLGVAAMSLGGVWTVSAAPSKEPFGLLLGPTLVLIGLAPAMAPLAPAGWAASALSAVVVAWGGRVLRLFPPAGECAAISV